MKQNFKQKLMAGLLSLCMIFQTAGIVPVYAAENVMDSGLPIGTSSVCTHHVHDENCGYTEGTPCNHEHTEDCNTEITKCVHEHTAECYPVQDSGEATGSEAKEPTACTHQCSAESGCITKELACKHVHNAECGYTEGTPCTFDPATCEICNPQNTADNMATFAVGEVYAVYDGNTFYAATADAPSTATTTVISDAKTINHLYIKGASVPEKLIGDPNSDDNTNLKTVTCADTVTSIDTFAFSACTGLTSVAMPNVTSIGENAFAYCKILASVDVSKVTTIGNRAFFGCAKLTSVAMPSAATIGVEAFMSCARLKSVAMPKVTTIGDSAFNDCTALASLTLGATPPTVGTEAFYKCSKTDALTIQGNTAIQDTVLAEYKAVADGATDELWYGWTLPNTISEVYAVYDGSSKKFYAATQTDQTTPTTTEITDKKTINHLYIKGESVPDKLMGEYDNLCLNLKTVTCADTVTTIGNRAFFSCKGLTNISLPSATTIGSEAFYGCNGLTSVALPSATTIGSEAFSDSKGLESVVLQRATSIGRLTFSGCTSLTSLTLGATPPATVGTNAFMNCPDFRTLTIQGNTAFKDTVLAAYKAAADGNVTDNLWYGWTLPTLLDGTGVSTSAGTLAVTTGNSNPTFGAENTITLTATFDKAAKIGKQRALAINEVEFKDGTNTLGTIATATQNADGKWVATLNVNTKDWAAGEHKLTAEYAGNNELGGSTTNEVTVTVNESYAVYDGGSKKFYAATQTDQTTPTTTEIIDKTTINNLYIMGASVPANLMSDCTNLKTVTCADTVTSIGNEAFSDCSALTSVQLPKVTSIGDSAFWSCTILASLTLGATPPTVGTDAFYGCPTSTLTIQGNTAFKDTVLAAYKAVADGDTTDNLWYGWTLPTALDGTGVSNSAGKLTAAGNTSANYKEENTITFTASFAKFGENKLRTLAENQISLLKGGVVVESKAATLTDGVYSATFTVNTNAFTVGTYDYTATFDGNRSLVSSTATETVTVTINKIDQAALNIANVPNKTYGDGKFTLSTTDGSGTGAVTYAVSVGNAVSVVESTGAVTVLKAGTATITATKAGDTNYNDATATTTITVNAAVPTIAWADAAKTETLTYTGNVASITQRPTVTLVNNESYDINGIQYAYKKAGSFSLFTGYTDGLPIAAGEYTIKAHIAAAGNYTAADSTNTMTLTINRADNSITNSSTTSKFYGEDFLIEYSIANTDTTKPTFTCEYKKKSAADSTYATALPTNAGEYTMRVSATATKNYNACSAIQDFVINQAQLNVTAGTAEPKKWDGTKTATVTGLTFKNASTSTLLEGDENLVMGKDFIVTNAEYVDAKVNTDMIKATVALQNTTKANNYSLEKSAFRFKGTPIALADGPAAPTFSAMNDTANTFTFHSANATVYEYSKDSGATWTEITASGETTVITVGNVALVAGALQVRVKATATHNASGVLANTAAQVFTATLEGTVAISGTATYGETLTATAAGTQSNAQLSYKWLDQNNVELQSGASNTYIIAGEAIGKTITIEVTATGYNGNLISSATNAVAKRAITVTAAEQSKTYGQTDPALTYTVSAGGLINNDTLTGALTRAAGEAPSTYAIAQGTLANAFYNITYVGASLTIGKASVALNVTVDPAAAKVERTVTIKVDAKNAANGLMTSGWSQPSGVTLTGSDSAALTLTSVAGSSGEYTASYTVPAGTAVGTQLTFTAAVADSTNNYTTPANATGTLTVTDKSAVKLTLQADKTTGVTYGDTVTYTAKVEKNNPVLDAPDKLDGTVSFYLGEVKTENLLATKTIGSDTLAVTLDSTKLTAGSHTVRALYSGNGDFATATQNTNTTVAKKVLSWDVSGLSALKKADGTKTAPLKGNLLLGGAIKDTDHGFSYTGISGEYDSAEAGERTVTVIVDGAVITNANYTLPAGKPTFTGTINPVNALPTPPESGSGTDYKLEQEVDISTVPEALKSNSNLDTPAKIEAQMKLSVQNAMSGVDTANIEIYDVTLWLNTDGITWTEVTEANFPTSGITVVLPYPVGTNKDSFNFTITHMFTTGAKAGTTETITPTKTASGLEFKLHSLSPIAVGYKAVSTDNGGGNGGGSGSSANDQYDFWQGIEGEIDAANSGDVIKVNTKSYDKMPWSVMNALREKNVGMVITWNDSNTITIPAGQAQKPEAGRIYYPLSLLAQLYKNIEFVETPAQSITNPETGGGYLDVTTGKMSPATGGILQVDPPATAPAITPDTPIVITPSESGFQQDDFAKVVQENEAKDMNQAAIFGAIALLLAGVGGVYLWKKKKEN